MDNKDLISEIGDRLKLAITISIFFPVFLGSFFGIIEVSTNSKNNAFFLFIFPALYIFVYFFFQLIKLRMPKWSLKSVNWATLFGIGCFIMPIVIMVVVSYKSLPMNLSVYINMQLFKVSLWGMGIIPALMAAFILFIAGFCLTEKIIQNAKIKPCK
jgi:hypothetical protein